MSRKQHNSPVLSFILTLTEMLEERMGLFYEIYDKTFLEQDIRE